MRARLTLPLALIAALTFARPAHAKELNVKAGQSLYEALLKARPGDTVSVTAGTYQAASLAIPSGIHFVSADGPGRARLDGQGHAETLQMYNRRDIVIDGFEIFHSGENAVKIEGGRNITLRHCKIHDAGDDCVKVTIGSHFITVEDCEIYNPGRHPDDGRYEQNVDFMDTERAVVRRCLLYHVGGHGDQIGFFKAGSRGCVFEQNVILNAGGGPEDTPAFTLGQESDSEWKHGAYECYDSIIRDNLFVNCRNGAIGFYGCKGGYAYGNILINSGPPFGFNRSCVSVHPAIDGVYIVNNVILNPVGNLESMFEGRQNLDGRMLHDYNVVWNGGKPAPRNCYEPHVDGQRPPLPSALTANPEEGYAAIAARFAAVVPRRAELVALLPAPARAGDAGRGLPVPPTLLATLMPPAAPAVATPAAPAQPLEHSVPAPSPAVSGPSIAEENPPARDQIDPRDASEPKTTRPRVAVTPRRRAPRSTYRRRATSTRRTPARRTASRHVAKRPAINAKTTRARTAAKRPVRKPGARR